MSRKPMEFEDAQRLIDETVLRVIAICHGGEWKPQPSEVDPIKDELIKLVRIVTVEAGNQIADSLQEFIEKLRAEIA